MFHLNHMVHEIMCGFNGGTGGPDPPKITIIYGFLAILVWIPENLGPSSARQQNAI